MTSEGGEQYGKITGFYSNSYAIESNGTYDLDFPWHEYLLLSFTVENYENTSESAVIGRPLFASMNTGRRVMLHLYSDPIEIYPNGDGKVHVVTPAIGSNVRLKISGFIKIA